MIHDYMLVWSRFCRLVAGGYCAFPRGSHQVHVLYGTRIIVLVRRGHTAPTRSLIDIEEICRVRQPFSFAMRHALPYNTVAASRVYNSPTRVCGG